MSTNELFDIARNLIEHEDNLINNRITWFLIFQGLLFGAFFQALSLFEGTKLPKPSEHQGYLLYALVLLCIVGSVSGLVAGIAIGTAENQITQVMKWWKDQPKGGLEHLPISGTPGFTVGAIVLRGSYFLAAFALVWATFLFLLFRAARR